jgi:hypothetical protein
MLLATSRHREFSAHQLGEEALMCAAELSEADRRDLGILQNQLATADLANPHCVQARLLRLSPKIGPKRNGDQIAALIFAEQSRLEWRQQVVPGKQIKLRSKAPGKRHLGDRDEQSAVRNVMDGCDCAPSDEGSHKGAGSGLVLKIDARRRAVLAAMEFA